MRYINFPLNMLIMTHCCMRLKEFGQFEYIQNGWYKSKWLLLRTKAIIKDVILGVFIAMRVKIMDGYTSRNCMASHLILITEQFKEKQLKQITTIWNSLKKKYYFLNKIQIVLLKSLSVTMLKIKFQEEQKQRNKKIKEIKENSNDKNKHFTMYKTMSLGYLCM